MATTLPLSVILAREYDTIPTSQTAKSDGSVNVQIEQNARIDSFKAQIDSLKLENEQLNSPGQFKTLIAIGGAALAMLGGLLLVYLKVKNTDFNESSIKVLGLILFFPTLILAFSVKSGISSEALAALLGTVAGYILARSSNKETTSQEPRPPSQESKPTGASPNANA